MDKIDPVHQDPDGQWYYYIETWHDRNGPFTSRLEAEQELEKYARFLHTGVM